MTQQIIGYLRQEGQGTGPSSLVFNKPEPLPMREQALGVIYTPLVAASISERAGAIEKAVRANGSKWPQELTSGVMFYMGERITKPEFDAVARARK